MNLRKSNIFTPCLIILVLVGMLFSSCGKKQADDLIILTRVESTQNGSSTGDVVASIISLGKENETARPLILTGGFYSAMSPAVSSDGRLMVFAAKQKKEDHWAIWEMDLSSSKIRQITSMKENCCDPAYLPTGRIVFCKWNDINGSSSVCTCKPDGSDQKQITFNPELYSLLNVLKDGRVVTLDRSTDTSSNKSVLMVMRPDGTKNQLFFEGEQDSKVISRIWETGSGKLVFVQDIGSGKGRIAEISYNRPLNSYKCLSVTSVGDYKSVFPLSSGKILAVYRKSDSEKYGLYEFDPSAGNVKSALFETGDFDITDVVVAQQLVRARKLPSEVDLGVKTGLLLCQDINFRDISVPVKEPFISSSRIRIVGQDSCLGDVAVAKDGSFYLKVKADTPFRIERLDDKGEVIGKPCSWIYLRPNERRGCVGCHEGLDMVPDNRVPFAVRQAPVGVPVHMSKVVEKKVSLE